MPSGDQPRFALLGAAGFVAPRHLDAIAAVGGDLVAVCDPHDSVGVLDKHFPRARYFPEPERFERFLEKEAAESRPIDYVSICTPNHLHDAHVRLALRSGAHAICEKPMVINPWNLDQLARVEERSGRRVYGVLQLRYDSELIRLRGMVGSHILLGDSGHLITDLTYTTQRGAWYARSWKGNEEMSGGILTNIGIHLFDALIWVFGRPINGAMRLNTPDQATGFLNGTVANVNWFLSTRNDRQPGQPKAVRNICVRGWSNGRSQYDAIDIPIGADFLNAHTKVYEEILADRGLGIEDCRPSIETVYKLRQRHNG